MAEQEEEIVPRTPLPPSRKPWQTSLRERITPFLPPPVVRGMQRLDPVLAPYVVVGPEATVTATFTVLVAAILLWLVSRFYYSSTRRRTSGGKAIQTDKNDHVVVHHVQDDDDVDPSFDETVILCGPRNGGKTRLFYQLLVQNNNEYVPTLMSIKANVGIHNHVRYVDWPGHCPVSDLVAANNDTAILTSTGSSNVRFVLVLDATQPVSAAADTLNELLEMIVASLSSGKNNNNKTTIFVACHKHDLPKAKNDRRIKIQLRTELEKILESSSSSSWWPSSSLAKAEIDLDSIDCVKLHFCSTTCTTTTGNNKGSTELMTFCRTGQLPSSGE